MDYTALAKKMGAVSSTETPQGPAQVDYNALASQFGSSSNTDSNGTFRYNVAPIATPVDHVALKKKAVEDAAIAQKKSDRNNSAFGIIKNTITGLPKALVKTVASSEIGLGKTIAKLDGKPRQVYLDQLTQTQEQQAQLIKTISQYEKEGKDATKLKQLYNSGVDQVAELQRNLDETNDLPSTGKVVGQLGGTALDVLTAGTYGKAAAGMKSGVLAKSSLPFVKKAATIVSPELGKVSEQVAKGIFTKKGATNVLKGAGLGYATDVTQGLQGARGENREGGHAFIPGLSTAVGAAIPLISESTQTVKNLNDPEFKANKLAAKRQVQLDKLDKYPGINKTVLKGNERGIDIKKVLSETDVMHGAVDKNGTIMTKGEGGPIEQYTREYIDGNESIVGDILKKEGRSISADAVKKKLNDAVMNSGIEGAALTQAKKKIDDEIAGYALKSGSNGTIPVSTLHDAKIDKYNGINFFTDGNTKKYDKTVAKALKEMVQENTSSVDVQKVNQELSKHFAVIDYLGRLDGKKVEGGKLGKYFAQTVGAMVGSHFGPLGTVAGAEAGGRIKGNLMSQSFNGKTGRTLPTSDVMNEAIRVKNAPPLELPAGQSSNNLGNLKINQSTTITPTMNDIPKIIPPSKEAGQIRMDVLQKGAKITAVATAAAAVFKKIQSKLGTGEYTRTDEPQKTIPKAIDPKRLGDALMQLESSGGTNKSNANDGELLWLTGLTPIAIKELKRTGIKSHINVNNKADVIDASVKYFQLLQKRNPHLTPDQVYVQKYWTNPEDTGLENKKAMEFNNLAEL